MTTAEPDLIELIAHAAPGGLLPGTAIEVRNAAVRGTRPRAAIFDFDGTLSLVREGWQQVMVPMMVETLASTPDGRHEPERALEACVRGFVDRLTGKQTIYQMIQLGDEVRLRGGNPLAPLEYKERYHQLLWRRIEGRVAGLERGAIDPESLRVPGGLEVLAALRKQGVALYLASGTDIHYVRREAEAIGVAEFFDPSCGGGGIYGALDQHDQFSKALVMQQMIRDHRLTGGELLAFGDGYVEIQNCKEFGGTAIGVASDEVRRAGVDLWKRGRLIQAGADVIVPDFREHAALLAWLVDGTEGVERVSDSGAPVSEGPPRAV